MFTLADKPFHIMLNSSLRPDAPNASSKSDEELQYCIDNSEKYLPESVEAALAELQNRGVAFTEEEIHIINEDIEAHVELAAASNSNIGMFSSSYKNSLVEDPDAYAFYSRRAIKVFTLFCGALFGSILFAINISKTPRKGEAVSVILFGILFTVIEVVISYYARLNTASGIFFGIVAAYSIDYFYWSKAIGNETLYRARSYRIPLAIALAIVALNLFLLFYNKR